MATIFYSLKEHLQSWLDENGIRDCAVIGLGKGHRGVELVLFKMTCDEFFAKYGRSFKTRYYGCCLTKSQYTEHQAYVSMYKIK